ncbi:hypothetical protein N7456_006413 [Penicillium angulare]|uniref:Uncharacterized protein n=1 Tax=Penicillium angulare TaxID=116970 RepID=A0A9W9FHN3_9EURO|nr:hypothetical protein N7456_006413 [Penicillium angulare]
MNFTTMKFLVIAALVALANARCELGDGPSELEGLSSVEVSLPNLKTVLFVGMAIIEAKGKTFTYDIVEISVEIVGGGVQIARNSDVFTFEIMYADVVSLG